MESNSSREVIFKSEFFFESGLLSSVLTGTSIPDGLRESWAETIDEQAANNSKRQNQEPQRICRFKLKNLGLTFIILSGYAPDRPGCRQFSISFIAHSVKFRQ